MLTQELQTPGRGFLDPGGASPSTLPEPTRRLAHG
jgi:hypothetical protein